MKFIDSLQDTATPWGRELLAHNLITVFANRAPTARYLLRSLSGELRGFLSDRYRRLDSRPTIEAFTSAVQRKGALPYDGYVTNTKVAVEAIMPEVYVPIPGEMVAYEFSLENSGFDMGRYRSEHISSGSGVLISPSLRKRCARCIWASGWTTACALFESSL